MDKITDCLKSVVPCRSQKEQGINALRIPLPMDLLENMPEGAILRITIQDENGNAQVLHLGVNVGNVSFSQKQKSAQEYNLPPLQFINPNYNIALKVSHSQYEHEYSPFQALLKNTASMHDQNILNEIETKKPAAFSALPVSNSSEPDADKALFEAVTFASDKEIMIMPHCQVRNALHNGHFFNASTGEALSREDFRSFEKAYAEDLKQQPAVQKGNFLIRTVPTIGN